MLDGAQPGHRELLVGHLAAAVPGVVGRHHEDLGAGDRALPQHVVVGDLVADAEADTGAGDVHDAGLGAGFEVRCVRERGDEAGQWAQRDVFGERDELLLGVRLPRTRTGLPGDDRVLTVAQSTDQHGHPQRVDGAVDHRVAVVGPGRAFRPHHEVRLGDRAAVDQRLELGGLAQVVGAQRVLGVEQAEADVRRVALHHRDGALTVLRLDGDQRADGERRGEGQHRPGGLHTRNPVGEAETGQHHGEAHQRGAADHGEPPERAVHLAERHAAPREAVERDQAARGLLQHEQQRCPHRSRGQPRDERHHGAGTADEQRHDRREDEPRPRAEVRAEEVLDPQQVRQEERHPEHETQTGRAPGARVAQGQPQHEERGDREPPERARREAQRQRTTGQGGRAVAGEIGSGEISSGQQRAPGAGRGTRHPPGPRRARRP